MLNTPAELNALHRKYWKTQAVLRNKRVAHPGVLAFALEQLDAEAEARIPLPYRRRFEFFLEQADRARERFGLAQKGGRARKSDALQMLIEGLVRNRPKTTLKELMKELKQRESGDVIDDIAGAFIHYKDCTREQGKKGQVISCRAKISGLKHRLTRARNKILTET
jgi:hypothetical protein